MTEVNDTIEVVVFVAGLYSTFIFKKSTRVARPASYLDFQLYTEFQFDRDLEESNLKSGSSREMSLGYELTPETTLRDSSPRIKRGVSSLSSGEDLLSSQEDLYDTARPKEESPAYTIQDSASPTGRNTEPHPQQLTDTPNSDQLIPIVNSLSDTDHQIPELHSQESDHFAENKNAELTKRDRSATNTPNEDLEDVPEQFLEKQEEEKETVILDGEECDDQHLEDEMPHEKIQEVQEEVAASSQRTSASRKDRMKGKEMKKRTAHFCPTAIDPAVTGQTCSVNYQSEVEQETVDDRELEDNVSVPAPPPFLFYQRKKRTETGQADVVVQEASFSTNTGSLRALRPRRSSSVADSKLGPGK